MVDDPIDSIMHSHQSEARVVLVGPWARVGSQFLYRLPHLLAEHEGLLGLVAGQHLLPIRR